MMAFQVPEYIRSMVPYVPGKPIEETQREFKLKRVIKLASNENPLGPSPKAVLAMRAGLAEMHRYPDGGAFRLKAALSKHLKVDSSSLIIGNGSNEIIDMLVRTYCVTGDAIATSRAAFIAYQLCAQIHGVRTVQTELTSELKFDLGALLEKVRADERVRIVFIANPNNPTGTYVTSDELREFLSELAEIRGGSVLVALDYAYWEYVNARDLPDPMKLLQEFSNVVMLRTFSKVYGLAGLRVGYGVASPPIISTLEKVRQPFNINALGLVAAEAALSDQAFVKRARRVNEQGMAFWEEELLRVGLPFWRSQGNFLLTDVQRGAGMTGPEVYQACLKLGVIFRPIANYGFPGALRISVGTPAENRVAMAALARAIGRESQKTGKSRARR
jgi:histidinol-phosphate aminotransferase